MTNRTHRFPYAKSLQAACFQLACLLGCLLLFATTAAADSPLRLRILCYNVHHCAGVDGKLDVERIANVIKAEKPDLVALQEIDRKTTRAKGVDQAEQLGRLTDMQTAFRANIKFQGGEYGNAVLSRFPIRSVKHHLLPNHREGEQRGVLAVDIQLSEDRLLTFCSTHFDHRRPDSERIASAEFVNKMLETRSKSGRSVLLAGDLNDVLGSKMFEMLSSHWRSANAEPIATIPVQRPARQIDFVLIPKQSDWVVESVEVLDESVASDHRPLLVVLRQSTEN